jgi:DNA-binding MarR family transcriptional regulator
MKNQTYNNLSEDEKAGLLKFHKGGRFISREIKRNPTILSLIMKGFVSKRFISFGRSEKTPHRNRRRVLTELTSLGKKFFSQVKTFLLF